MGGLSGILAERHRARARLVPLIGVIALISVACIGAGAATIDSDGDVDTPEPVGTEPGDLAPDFELTLFETENHQAGEVLRLSELQGRPVVLNFWFPSCPPCVAEMPDLEQTFQNHKADDVEFIGVQLVGLDTAQDGQDFVDTIGVTYALGPDEDGSIVISDYQVPGFPTTIFIDGDRRVVRKWSGALNGEKLEEFVQEILN